MKTNIILTGMPGAGKSTVGVILAKTLGMNFVDVDIRISQTQGMRLQEILDTCGIGAFLQAEEQEALSITDEHAVISTGGSMVMSKRAMTYLQETGVNIYLDVPLDALEERLVNIRTRGVVPKPGETIADIWLVRRPLYEKYAEVTIPCGDRTTEEIVSEICTRLKEWSEKRGC